VIGIGGTIVATATAAAAGSRGVVRVSGSDAVAAARACATIDGRTGTFRSAVRTSLGEVPVIAMVSRAPASFTGEDTVELALTGHPSLLDAVVAALHAHPGVRRAGPGEFTARAFAAGRIDLLEAEAIAIAISAADAEEVAAAREIARGGLGASAREGADRLADVLAAIEAGIDFTDEEDVVTMPPERLSAALDDVECRLRNELAPRAARAAGRGHLPLVALVGPPNAGKSSLFNALLGRERSVTAPVRGTTRDAIVEDLVIDHRGCPVRLALADLAGEGTTDDPLDAASRRRRDELVAEADLIVRCVPPDGVMPACDARTIVVATKCDQGQSASDHLATSARTGVGIEILRHALAGRSVALAPRESLVDAATGRHVEALERALAAIARARALVPGVRGRPEIVAAAVSEAIGPLRELTGVGTPDEVLGRIFARFCIGK
jgi:tRNA modification GTPase